MSLVVLGLAAAGHAAALFTTLAPASEESRPYCGYSFAITLAADEVIQFTRNDKTTNYFAELRAGELKLIERGPMLSSAVEQRRLKSQSDVETLRLTRADRFLGYRVRDRRQGIDTILTGAAFDGSKRDLSLLDRFNFGPKRQKSCMRIRIPT